MYAPVFFPQAAPPSPEILRAERAILDEEGQYHVEGRYFANATDADRQRRWAAERRVREEVRRSDWRTRWEAPAAALVPVRSPAISTWLTARERARVAAANIDGPAMAHRESLRAVRDDLAMGRADAALVSAALMRPAEVPGLIALVRGFPGSPVVALVSDADEAQALAAALLFGRAGVQCLLDCRHADGWRAFRGAFVGDRVPDAFMREALAAVLADIDGEGEGCPAGCARFFAFAFDPRGGYTKRIAARLGTLPSSLTSRFHRAGLPSPRRYATFARLVWAAHVSELPGTSARAIAYQLGASSPQSFARTIHLAIGMTAAEFRSAFTGRSMLDRFRETLVIPHRERLGRFDPTGYGGSPDGSWPRVGQPRGDEGDTAKAMQSGIGRAA